jgi:hypothetical protein
MGGTDVPSNLVKVNTAMHAFLHKCLWEEHGFIEDKLAWLGLTGQIGKDEILQELSKRPKSDEHKRKMSESAKRFYDTKEGRKIHARAIKLAAKTPRTEEFRKNLSKIHTGKVLSERHREIIRQTHLGKKQTPEQIAKRVAATRKTKLRKGMIT